MKEQSCLSDFKFKSTVLNSKENPVYRLFTVSCRVKNKVYFRYTEEGLRVKLYY